MPATAPERLTSFIHECRYTQLPTDVRSIARRSLMDLLGSLAAGSVTKLGGIVRRVVTEQFAGDQATVAFSALRSTAAGAALANGMMIDAMDSHDGHRLAKGHAGSGILPAVLAMAEIARWGGASLLAAMIVGYEIALRAGISLHASASDYHSSGAWVALGAAAIGARGSNLGTQATLHALGIAEYHGPRSPMMRCIDHPSMLKDGAGWGSFVGLLSANLAGAGFTGAPATLVSGDQQASLWSDLGNRWRVRELYYKPYACCRWAQPSVAAALRLKAEHSFELEDIQSVLVSTFSEAARLTVSRPQDTEQAQYSLPYAMAAALKSGRLGPEEVRGKALGDLQVLGLAERVRVAVDAGLDAEFPAKALAKVRIILADGRRVEAPITAAPGGSDDPMSEDELQSKYMRYSAPVLGSARAQAIFASLEALDQSTDLAEFFGLLTGAV